MSQLTSEEVNYLIYRYLQEAGFVHSAFSFGQESFITKSDIKPSAVPTGMLIGLLQRGLQYQAVEYHLNEDGTEKECVRPWSLLDPHVCVEAKPSGGGSHSKDGKAKASSSRIISIEEGMAAEDAALLAKKESKKRKKESSNGNKKPSNDSNGVSEPKEKMAKAMVERFLESEVVVLTGHQSEVISCAWNPVAESGLLASVAGDDTARIWPIPPDAKLDPEAIVGRELVLAQGHGEGESRDITTLDWSPDGRALAVGCYDGKAMLWSAQGALIAQLDGFKGPVFALRWSPSGRFIAGAGLDHCAVVWEASSPGTPVKLFRNHASPTMDLDWRDDACFATCTTEKTIYVYHMGADRMDAGDDGTDSVRRVFKGHEDEINSVRWSPDGSLLASCSDDTTARIWDIGGEPDEAKWVLAGHAKEIYCLEWSPTGPGTANPTLPPLLATASFDATVRLWDPLTGRCLHVLARHTEPVYAIGFSPDGRFLASGSLDETLNIWAVADGRLVRTYDSGRGGIFEIAWSPSGSRLSACTSDSTVCVFDFRP